MLCFEILDMVHHELNNVLNIPHLHNFSSQRPALLSMMQTQASPHHPGLHQWWGGWAFRISIWWWIGLKTPLTTRYYGSFIININYLFSIRGWRGEGEEEGVGSGREIDGLHTARLYRVMRAPHRLIDDNNDNNDDGAAVQSATSISWWDDTLIELRWCRHNLHCSMTP